jgi:dTMP kinase
MKHLNHGFLLTIEGIDGSGKSTLAALLRDHYKAQNVPVVFTREPGDTPLGKDIRAILHSNRLTMNGLAEFMLFSADRSQHIAQVIKPALENKSLIICDRMADSSRAYQGYGRGLDLQKLEMVTSWVMDGVKPDCTLYVALDIETAMQRLHARNQELTRLEQQPRSFYEAVINGFETLFKDRSDVIRIDAKQSIEAVFAAACAALDPIVQKVVVHE